MRKHDRKHQNMIAEYHYIGLESILCEEIKTAKYNTQHNV